MSRDSFGDASRGIEPAKKDAKLPEASVSPAARAALSGSRSAGSRGPVGMVPLDPSYILLAGCREEEKSYEHTVTGAAAGSTTHGC